MLKLIAKSLRCVRGGRVLIRELSFTLAKGEALIVRGPNGSGKTTLLRAIAGFHAPEAGAVRLEGGHTEKTVAEQCWHFGHLNAIKPQFTCRENLRFVQAYFGATGLSPDDALGVFGLNHIASLPAGYLSAGQKRRLAFCRLLVSFRPLWLLDEPSVSLDVASTEVMERMIAAHQASGGIAVIATHTALSARNARLIDLGAEAAQPPGAMQ
jgi:heme exporter protein A